jgi:hypothetical protein
MISMEFLSRTASRVMSGKRLVTGEGETEATWAGTHEE